jgi:DNA-binding NarL/FixJ family response regulator
MYLTVGWRLFQSGKIRDQMLKDPLMFDQAMPPPLSHGVTIEVGPRPTSPGSSEREQCDPTPVTVLVVDSQTLFRTGLARLLDEDEQISVVAVSEGTKDLPELCAAKSIDVVLTDVQVKDWDGIELIRMISRASLATRVIVLAAKADWRVTAAMAAGAAGYLLKDAEPESIRSAVISAHLGARVLSDEAAQWLMHDNSGCRLTRRERDIFEVMGRGATNREIAQLLGLSEKTVRNYVSRLYRKLAVQNRAQISPLRSYPDLFAAYDLDGKGPLVAGPEERDRVR